MEYQIITDGSCDLPSAIVQEKNLLVVPFYVSFDNKTYQKAGEEIDIVTFYEKMVANPKLFPKSSMPSVQDYVDVFEPVVKKGIRIICICITTKFSGSMQSALTARNMLSEEYPNADITIIDSTINTVLQGIYVLEAVRMQEAGFSYEKVVRKLEEIKTSGRIFFTVENMEYLSHGGRIGRLTGLAGSILGIKPLITLKEGEIFPSGITRSRKKSMDKIIELLLSYLEETGKEITAYSLAIGFGYDKQEAEDFRMMVLKALQKKFYPKISFTKDKLPIFRIGETISVHTGPYPLGLGIVEKSISY